MMEENDDLPFKPGQFVETRSFIPGYRGAWFNCKIREIRGRGCGMECTLEYPEFPDQPVRWTKFYKKARRSRTSKGELMMRPRFPSVYRRSELSNVKTIPEVVVVANDKWKVGDLVDWWSDGCYWSGKLVAALGNDKFQVELLPPPLGEGQFYDALSENLRPSLNWSLEFGWTVPTPEGNENIQACAQLIRPATEEGSTNLTAFAIEGNTNCVEARAGTSVDCNTSFCSHFSGSYATSLGRSQQTANRPLTPKVCEEAQTLEVDINLGATDSDTGKTSCSDSVSSSHVRVPSTEAAQNAGEKANHHDSVPSKKTRTSVSIFLNSRCSDSMEAAILDLEELVNKVKWIKGILEFGSSSKNMQPSWKFLEHRPES
ncbi:hypothetical protein K2173_021531 [Erythroxylum novogranatense]|uniref:Agenet domain-containing protein n=1 Tax=Erythroxylum novogranatense TaxID=1862640 RepID=A0AAV8TRC4_9ROSI|nr:hypothetical protein K2173_021531 [Erythroxylum novogranatense]